MTTVSGLAACSLGFTSAYSFSMTNKSNTSDDPLTAGSFSGILDNRKETSEKSNFAIEQEKLDQYLAARDKAFKAKYGDSLPETMTAVAMPYVPGVGAPFVTAEQQQLIDSITDKYIGKKDVTGLMEELAANGVHPDQIAAGANYFINTGGKVTYENRNLASAASFFEAVA